MVIMYSKITKSEIEGLCLVCLPGLCFLKIVFIRLFLDFFLGFLSHSLKNQWPSFVVDGWETWESNKFYIDGLQIIHTNGTLSIETKQQHPSRFISPLYNILPTLH